MQIPPIELGNADLLLTEGRQRAKRDNIPFMEALKMVIAEKLNERLNTREKRGNRGTNPDL